MQVSFPPHPTLDTRASTFALRLLTFDTRISSLISAYRLSTPDTLRLLSTLDSRLSNLPGSIGTSIHIRHSCYPTTRPIPGIPTLSYIVTLPHTTHLPTTSHIPLHLAPLVSARPDSRTLRPIAYTRITGLSTVMSRRLQTGGSHIERTIRFCDAQDHRHGTHS